jgi:AmmeMemoRadiSam system protein B
VISTDFSHYPSFNDAIMADQKTAETFVSNKVDKFIEAMYENEKIKI